jgi:hypothetical protein
MTAGLEQVKLYLDTSEPMSRLREQPAPVPSDRPLIADLVIADLATYGFRVPGLADDVLGRNAKGTETYGVGLQAFNGRDASLDLYWELLDGLMYSRQILEELGGEGPASTEVQTQWGHMHHVYVHLMNLTARVKKMRSDTI